MRIIAGSLKGRRLKAPTWDGLRPTSDKLRETLFNVLAPRMAGARVLDGYAGTGAVGIEALSRGASHVVFVDNDRRAQLLIGQNLDQCGVAWDTVEGVGGGGCVIIRDSIQRALATLGSADPFDIILFDPPYGLMNDTSVQTSLAAAGDLLSANGILVVEHARRDAPPESIGRMRRTRLLEAGDSALTFYSCP